MSNVPFEFTPIARKELIPYYEKQFVLYNEKFFKGKLLQAPIVLKGLGHFNARAVYVIRRDKSGFVPKRYGELADCISVQYRFSPKVGFSREIADVLLLHEMCHAAVFEVHLSCDFDKYLELVNTGHEHGSVWQKYMTLCGLVPPDNYVTIDFRAVRNAVSKASSLSEVFTIINSEYEESTL